MASGGEEKTEQASPKKRDDAREKGQSAKSAELSGALVLAASIGVVAVMAPMMIGETKLYMLHVFSNLNGVEITYPTIGTLVVDGLNYMIKVLGPLLLIALVIAIVGSAVQEKFMFAKKALAPKWSRISPKAGAKKIFSSQSVVEFAKGMLKLILLGAISYWIIKSTVYQVLSLVGMHPEQVLIAVGSIGAKLAFACAGILLAIAIPDKVYTKWFFEKSIRMTKKEVMDEHKEHEGDPHIKAEIKRKMRQAAMRRMMSAIPTADVVVTNPVHYAVALKYESGKGAPQVVAKGARLIAQRIKEEAKKHRVPIVENPPLARALYKSVEIGAYIPNDLYQAVAEVLAFVYSLGKRRRV